MLLVPNSAILIECKSTEVGTSLITLAHHGKVGKVQIAKHRLWHRAGHRTLYLYGDLAKDSYVWHSGQNVVRKINAPIATGPMQSLLYCIPGVLYSIMELDHASTI